MMEKIKLVIIIIIIFLSNKSNAQQVEIYWDIAATANITMGDKESGGICVGANYYNCNDGNKAPGSYQGIFSEKIITAPCNGFCEISISINRVSKQNAAKVCIWVDYSNHVWGRDCSGHDMFSLSYDYLNFDIENYKGSFAVTKGTKYNFFVYAENNCRVNLNYSWTASEPVIARAFDNGKGIIDLSKTNEQHIGYFRLDWGDYDWPDTSFHCNRSDELVNLVLTSNCSDSSVAHRIGTVADGKCSGNIYATFSNQNPSVTLINPQNGATIENSTPEFQFRYSDPENDAQKTYRVQISKNPQFSAMHFDTGNISSSATAYALPSSKRLNSNTQYYWRVYVTDLYGKDAYSNVRAIMNTAVGQFRLIHEEKEFASGDEYSFFDSDRGETLNATFKIENQGNDELRIDSVEIEPQGTFFVLEPKSFPLAINPASNTDLSINFVPSQNGSYSAQLKIISNDPEINPFYLMIKGRCIDWAFRYKEFLYSKDGDYIYGKLNNISDYWGDEEREKAQLLIKEFQENLQNEPGNNGHQWALLDVYYDTALAELLIAQEKLIEALQLSMGINLTDENELIINQEIALLEDAQKLYQKGLKVYFDLLNDKMAINTSDIDSSMDSDLPFGYYIFSKEVPNRSLLSPLGRNAQGDYVLPYESEPNSYTSMEVYKGYKDLLLLLRIEKEYVKASSRLIRLYLLKMYAEGNNTNYQVNKAGRLIGQILQSSCLEVETLLNCFNLNFFKNAQEDVPQVLVELFNSWQSAINELSYYKKYCNGESNLFGLQDDIFVLVRSNPEGSDNNFNSYDNLTSYMMNGSRGGPLVVAQTDLNKAKTDYRNYRDRQDQLAYQLKQCRDQYDERLRSIVGVRPGEPGYDNPSGNPGSQIALQELVIKRARQQFTALQSSIKNTNTMINNEIQRRAKERDIKDAIQKVILDYGEKKATLLLETQTVLEAQSKIQSGVSTAITNFNINMNNIKINNNEEEGNGDSDEEESDGNENSDSGGSDGAGNDSSGSDGSGSDGGGSDGGGSSGNGSSGSRKRSQNKDVSLNENIPYTNIKAVPKQNFSNYYRSLKNAEIQRLSSKERVDILSLEEGLLDINTSEKIKVLTMQMQTQHLDAIDAAIQIEVELGKLESLLNEKESLERLRIESNAELADRYFADPGHRLLKDKSLIRAELSFQRAQKWAFLTAKALEYKWNQKFKHQYNDRQFSTDGLFQLRNADEIMDFYYAMEEFNQLSLIGVRHDDGYKILSFRDDFLYLSFDELEKFQEYINTRILDADHPNNPMSVKALHLKLNTVKEYGGFFNQERWLEKINFLKVHVLGGGNADSMIDGYIEYGGTSYIRNMYPGIQDPLYPERLVNEMTAYPVRYLYYDLNTEQWKTRNVLGSSVFIQTSDDENVNITSYQINTFKECSVAASDWSIYIACEEPNGNPLLDIKDISDVEIHFSYYLYSRQKQNK